jgi:D-lactate dehydrogenase
MMIPEGKYKTLLSILSGKIDPGRIFTDYLHTLAYGSDASLYRLVPRIVVNANDEEEVSFILRSCSELMIPVTFRAAGTSLSGQAVSDSVLLVAGSNWKRWSISADAGKIILQPGITGGKANVILAPYGRKIGPDPASINAAMIGGIAANNASGMCCGTAENSYKTVAGMRIVFADGSILDTNDNASREAFRSTHPGFIAAVSMLGSKTRENEKLAGRIRKKYKIKNTTGYSLNALVDFIDPFDIIEHLMIGSEGTLGFISSLTYTDSGKSAIPGQFTDDLSRYCHCLQGCPDTQIQKSFCNRTY